MKRLNCALVIVGVALLSLSGGAATRLSFDRTSLLLDGKRIFLASGEFHYFRVPKADWKRRLELLKAAGGNCVATYVPWCVHEEKEGEIRFNDAPQRDLDGFLKAVAEAGLVAIVRPGPYQYSELVYDGLPRWLIEGHPEILKKNSDGSIVGKSSVDYNHPLFLEKTRNYFRAVAKVLRPHLAENGGPVALVQLDNELTGIHVWYGYKPDEAYFEDCAKYLETLKGYLAENGIRGPYCHNGGGATMSANYRPCVRRLGSRDFLLGYDHYYGLFPFVQESPSPSFFRDALFSCDLMRAYGYPPVCFESQCGNIGDTPPIFREDLLANYMLNLAAGVRGINYYVFTGGPNPKDMGTTFDLYDYHAPVAADGTERPTYGALKAFGDFVAAHPQLVAAERVTSVRVGGEWQHFAGLASYDRDFQRDGAHYALMMTPYHPEYCLLEGEIPTDGKPLVLAGLTTMSAEAQRHVADYVRRGGSLLVAPDFPRKDLAGKPCTILAEALGASAIAPSTWNVAARPAIEIGGKRLYGYVPKFERGRDGLTATWTVGKGRVRWFGCTWQQRFFNQAECLGNFVAELGAKPVVASSNLNVLTTAYRLEGNKLGVFALNLRPATQETTLSREGGAEVRVALPPMTVAYRELPACSLVSSSDESFRLMNILPYSPGEETRLAREAAAYAERTGFREVLYCLTCDVEGAPAAKKVDELCASFRKFRNAPEVKDLRVGVLLQAIVGHWPHDVQPTEPWTPTRGLGGKEGARRCVLDPRFAAYVRETAAKIARERPAFLLGDDDIRPFGYVGEECFCDRHAAAFAQRTGRAACTSAKMRRIVASAARGSRDEQVFRTLQREAVNGVCRLIREGLDAVDPTIDAGVCLPMAREEPRFYDQAARAIAGAGRPTLMRVGNGQYLEREPRTTVGRVLSAYAIAELHGDVDWLLDEADTYPQTLWSRSAVGMHAKICMSALCGFRGALTWYVGTSRGRFRVNEAYDRIIGENAGLYRELARLSRATVADGVAIPLPSVFPDADAPIAEGDGWGDKVCAAFGVPFRCTTNFADRASVFALAGARLVSRLSDGELKALLAGRVLVDGAAAEALAKRGFEKLLGVRVGASKRPPFVCELAADGTRLTLSSSADAAALSDPDPKAAVLSHLANGAYAAAPQLARVAPATTVFTNALGGVVAVTAWKPTLAAGFNGGPLNEARRQWFLGVLAAVGGAPLPVVADHEQDVLVQARVARGAVREGGGRLLLVSNLGYDPIPKIRLRCATRPRRIAEIAGDGARRPVAFAWADGVAVLERALPCYGVAALEVTLQAAAELHGRVTGLERISAKNARGAEVRAWSGACWRNERVHAPFVVWGDGVDALRAEVGALVGPGGATIPARVRWVGEVLVDDRPHGAKVDPVRYPPYLSGDILDAAMPFRLTDAGYRALWVSARTPAEAAPGVYRGRMTVRGGGRELAFPIALTVRAATLPKARKFHLDIWQTPWTIARYYGVEPFSPEHYAKMAPYLRELADAGGGSAQGRALLPELSVRGLVSRLPGAAFVAALGVARGRHRGLREDPRPARGRGVDAGPRGGARAHRHVQLPTGRRTGRARRSCRARGPGCRRVGFERREMIWKRSDCFALTCCVGSTSSICWRWRNSGYGIMCSRQLVTGDSHEKRHFGFRRRRPCVPDGCSGLFSLSLVAMKNLEIRVHLDKEKMYPTTSAANLHHVARLVIQDCQFCLDDNVGDTELGKCLLENPCHTVGLHASGDQNDQQILRDVAVQGFKYGYVFGEHVVADRVRIDCRDGNQNSFFRSHEKIIS